MEGGAFEREMLEEKDEADWLDSIISLIRSISRLVIKMIN